VIAHKLVAVEAAEAVEADVVEAEEAVGVVADVIVISKLSCRD
jgi:hypothetical protein